MFDYIDRVIITSMFTSIEKDWGITHTLVWLACFGCILGYCNSYIPGFNSGGTAGAEA